MQLDFINRGPTEFGVPPTPIGLPTLTKWAFDGVDLAPVWNMLVHRVTKEPDDAAAETAALRPSLHLRRRVAPPAAVNRQKDFDAGGQAPLQRA